MHGLILSGGLPGEKEILTHEWQSLSHVKWECKYHVVILPKYRRKDASAKKSVRVCVSRFERETSRCLTGTACRTHPHVLEYPAQVQFGPNDRFPEWQERGSNPSRLTGRAANNRLHFCTSYGRGLLLYDGGITSQTNNAKLHQIVAMEAKCAMVNPTSCIRSDDG